MLALSDFFFSFSISLICGSFTFVWLKVCIFLGPTFHLQWWQDFGNVICKLVKKKQYLFISPANDDVNNLAKLHQHIIWSPPPPKKSQKSLERYQLEIQTHFLQCNILKGSRWFHAIYLDVKSNFWFVKNTCHCVSLRFYSYWL